MEFNTIYTRVFKRFAIVFTLSLLGTSLAQAQQYEIPGSCQERSTLSRNASTLVKKASGSKAVLFDDQIAIVGMLDKRMSMAIAKSDWLAADCYGDLMMMMATLESDRLSFVKTKAPQFKNASDLIQSRLMNTGYVKELIEAQIGQLANLTAEIIAIMDELRKLDAPDRPESETESNKTKILSRLNAVQVTLSTGADTLDSFKLPGVSSSAVQEEIQDTVGKISAITEYIQLIMKELSELDAPAHPDDNQSDDDTSNDDENSDGSEDDDEDEDDEPLPALEVSAPNPTTR